jgi:hypothetical protein
MTRRTDILSSDDMKRIRAKAATTREAAGQPVEELVPSPRPEETRSPVSAR